MLTFIGFTSIGIGLGGIISYFYFTATNYLIPKSEGDKLTKQLELLKNNIGEM